MLYQKLPGSVGGLYKAYPNDAGWDLPVAKETVVGIGCRVKVPTALAVAIPTGYFGWITGRSSAQFGRGLTIIPGIIDAGFRGELFALVDNHSKEVQYILPGTSIAQLIVIPVHLEEFRELKLPEAERGENGFGSSGRA